MSDLPLFGEMRLSEALNRDLYRMNPWWRGEPMQLLPVTRRHLVAQIKRRMQVQLAKIIVVRGPRQIGKTTAQLHIIQDLLDQGVSPTHIFRIQFEEISSLLKWDAIVWPDVSIQSRREYCLSQKSLLFTALRRGIHFCPITVWSLSPIRNSGRI